mgnify:CR=1 FL=1
MNPDAALWLAIWFLVPSVVVVIGFEIGRAHV